MDTRALPEIWEGLSPLAKRDFYQAVQRRTSCCRQTVYRWCTGRTKPVIFLHRKEMCSIVRSNLGIRTTPEILFDYAES